MVINKFHCYELNDLGAQGFSPINYKNNTIKIMNTPSNKRSDMYYRSIGMVLECERLHRNPTHHPGCCPPRIEFFV